MGVIVCRIGMVLTFPVFLLVSLERELSNLKITHLVLGSKNVEYEVAGVRVVHSAWEAPAKVR